jgi:hypothetical protein
VGAERFDLVPLGFYFHYLKCLIPKNKKARTSPDLITMSQLSFLRNSFILFMGSGLLCSISVMYLGSLDTVAKRIIKPIPKIADNVHPKISIGVIN